MEHTGFPSDETLAAFIDGRLDPETRRQVIAHMATCPECYSVFMSATEMGEVAAAPNGSHRSSRQAWLAVAVTAVAAAFSIVFLVTPVRDFVLPHHDSGLDALARAAPEQRTIAGRISGFPYQTMAHLTRGESVDPMKDPANAKLLIAAAAVQRSVTESRSSANLHAVGVATLLLGHPDVAVDTLHEALLAETGRHRVADAIDDSNDVRLLNDLSVALSNRTAVHPKTDDEALRCAEKAWRIGRTPEAAWNRAIATETLNGAGSDAAGQAWQDYLAIDPASPWATEARKRLEPAK
ncbi:MAG TPA: zf-HC2 domain-containing protein [Thermoanaerobaculia bacterium]